MSHNIASRGCVGPGLRWRPRRAQLSRPGVHPAPPREGACGARGAAANRHAAGSPVRLCSGGAAPGGGGRAGQSAHNCCCDPKLHVNELRAMRINVAATQRAAAPPLLLRLRGCGRAAPLVATSAPGRAKSAQRRTSARLHCGTRDGSAHPTCWPTPLPSRSGALLKRRPPGEAAPLSLLDAALCVLVIR